ncbi:hypothetical protein GOBAR_DD22992 [Gossypium barbadense]|nr:hypothetical protein GOBAR_DD22992 [Gossypium barbadense]
MSSDEDYYIILYVGEILLLTTREGDVEGVEFDREGDDEGVESDGKGDLERVESIGEGDGGEVQVDGEGVSVIGIEVDKYGSVESGGQISLGSTVGKDNDSEVVVDEYVVYFATLDGVDNDADEYGGDFATSDGVDNVASTSNGEKEDGNKTEGLEIAISDILPRVEHRNCARHVFANWSGRKLGKYYECDFWQIVKCMTEREKNDLCSALKKKDKDAYDNLMKKSPKMWTRAFLGTTCKSDIVYNNLCEAFNSSIVEARFKSIIKMLEDIRTKMMTRIV